LSRSCSKTSRCSSNGSLSICSKTWAALMAAIYSFESSAQAAFSARTNYCNPVGVGLGFLSFPQGSSCVTTPGWMTQSLWDWPKRISSSTRSRQSAIGNQQSAMLS
jgi:hypothetical protein